VFWLHLVSAQVQVPEAVDTVISQIVIVQTRITLATEPSRTTTSAAAATTTTIATPRTTTRLVTTNRITATELALEPTRTSTKVTIATQDPINSIDSGKNQKSAQSNNGSGMTAIAITGGGVVLAACLGIYIFRKTAAKKSSTFADRIKRKVRASMGGVSNSSFGSNPAPRIPKMEEMFMQEQIAVPQYAAGPPGGYMEFNDNVSFQGGYAPQQQYQAQNYDLHSESGAYAQYDHTSQTSGYTRQPNKYQYYG
jgi:hypothetical protein